MPPNTKPVFKEMLLEMTSTSWKTELLRLGVRTDFHSNVNTSFQFSDVPEPWNQNPGTGCNERGLSGFMKLNSEQRKTAEAKG